MNIKNCVRCGRIYVYDGYSLCIDCRRADEEDFNKVKEYLDENPGANVMEVSEATGVETKKIIQFLREGRLEVKDETNLILDCERCGKPIKTGRFCEKCSKEMEKEMLTAIGGKNAQGLSSGKVEERIKIADRHRKKW